MSSPATLGDLCYQITQVIPLSTSTAAYYSKTSGTSTGTKLTTSRTIDLSLLPHVGVTGGKPLDATVHPRAVGVPRWKSVTLSVPLKLTFQTSGLNFHAIGAILTRSAASGAGSTWVTIATRTARWKMGTDTDAVHVGGFCVSANGMNVKRFLKANITYATRKPTSTAAKDTTTGVLIYSGAPMIQLSGADQPYTVVPKIV